MVSVTCVASIQDEMTTKVSPASPRKRAKAAAARRQSRKGTEVAAATVPPLRQRRARRAHSSPPFAPSQIFPCGGTRYVSARATIETTDARITYSTKPFEASKPAQPLSDNILWRRVVTRVAFRRESEMQKPLAPAASALSDDL